MDQKYTNIYEYISTKKTWMRIEHKSNKKVATPPPPSPLFLHQCPLFRVIPPFEQIFWYPPPQVTQFFEAPTPPPPLNKGAGGRGGSTMSNK